MIDAPDDLTPPEPDFADTTHALMKAAIASLPFVGGGAAELLDRWLEPPLVERRRNWLERVVARLLELEERVQGFTAEDAFENDPAFVTSFLHASQIAQRTHQEEKREALCNAVLNAALSNAPNEDVHAVFFTFIEELTPSHLWTLNNYVTGRSYEVDVRDLQRSRPRPFDTTPPLPFIPELGTDLGFANRVIQDLLDRKLMTITQVGIEVSSNNMRYLVQITDFGKQFLRFITEPQVSP